MTYIKTPTLVSGSPNSVLAASSVASNSSTPGEYSTVFVAVAAIRDEDAPNTPTMSGTNAYNVTYELVDSHYLDAVFDYTVWIYRIEIGASPSAGVVTASFGEEMDAAYIALFEIAEDGHYANVVTASIISTDTSSNSPSVTLGATPGGSDTVLGFILHAPGSNDPPSAGTNFIRIAGAEITNNSYLDMEYDVDATSTSVPWTTTVGSDKILIAFTLEDGDAIPGGGGGGSTGRALINGGLINNSLVSGALVR